MASTAHFPDPVSFQQQSNEFISWLTGKPGVRMNSKIRMADLRSLDAGRGVGTCPISPPKSLTSLALWLKKLVSLWYCFSD